MTDEDIKIKATVKGNLGTYDSIEEWQKTERGNPYSGKTLRDEFALAAMQAMITKSSGQDSIGGKRGVPLIAKYAYEYADAMMKEREQNDK